MSCRPLPRKNNDSYTNHRDNQLINFQYQNCLTIEIIKHIYIQTSYDQQQSLSNQRRRRPLCRRHRILQSYFTAILPQRSNLIAVYLSRRNQIPHGQRKLEQGKTLRRCRPTRKKVKTSLPLSPFLRSLMSVEEQFKFSIQSQEKIWGQRQKSSQKNSDISKQEFINIFGQKISIDSLPQEQQQQLYEIQQQYSSSNRSSKQQQSLEFQLDWPDEDENPEDIQDLIQKLTITQCRPDRMSILPGHKPQQQPSGCICKKTQCLKLYCQCFQNGAMCSPQCECLDCQNNESFTEHRDYVIKQILEKDPEAFHQENQEQHKGCNCKKSKCLKKYCECYTSGLSCGPHCNCEQCENTVTLTKEQLLHQPQELDCFPNKKIKFI